MDCECVYAGNHIRTCQIHLATLTTHVHRTTLHTMQAAITITISMVLNAVKS